LIGGLIPASRGRIQVNGQDLGKLTTRARPYLRRAVGVILQDTHLLNDRSAYENVLMPLIVTGHDRTTAVARARAAIEKGWLAGKDGRRPIELTGGDQQRLEIARAIANRPAILTADEPTANLGSASARRIIEVFRDFNRVGVTMLIATPDETLMADYSTRVLHVERGQVHDFVVPRNAETARGVA